MDIKTKTVARAYNETVIMTTRRTAMGAAKRGRRRGTGHDVVVVLAKKKLYEKSN